MKERPIIFSGAMVLAIQDERKTQTRRLRGLAEVNREPSRWRLLGPVHDGLAVFTDHLTQSSTLSVHCPYGAVGDRLIVKEAVRRRPDVFNGLSGATYLADLTAVMGKGPMGSYCNGRALYDWKWKRDALPSMFMPLSMSRITLELTGVRVERVQSITGGDISAEGFPGEVKVGSAYWWYRDLWDGLNVKRGYPWADNPWVWVLGFRRMT